MGVVSHYMPCLKFDVEYSLQRNHSSASEIYCFKVMFTKVWKIHINENGTFSAWTSYVFQLLNPVIAQYIDKKEPQYTQIQSSSSYLTVFLKQYFNGTKNDFADECYSIQLSSLSLSLSWSVLLSFSSLFSADIFHTLRNAFSERRQNLVQCISAL